MSKAPSFIPVTASRFADLILHLNVSDCQTKGQKQLQLVLLFPRFEGRKAETNNTGGQRLSCSFASLA